MPYARFNGSSNNNGGYARFTPPAQKPPEEKPGLFSRIGSAIKEAFTSEPKPLEKNETLANRIFPNAKKLPENTPTQMEEFSSAMGRVGDFLGKMGEGAGRIS